MGDMNLISDCMAIFGMHLYNAQSPDVRIAQRIGGTNNVGQYIVSSYLGSAKERSAGPVGDLGGMDC